MKRFKNILFVREASANNQAALKRTLTLAENNQANLTVVDIVEDAPTSLSAIPKGYSANTLLQAILEERQEQLAQLTATLNHKMAVNTVILQGIPYLEIIRKILRDNYDLVVKPISHNVGIKDRLFGGTDLHLLRKCPVPVWLMNVTQNNKIEKILAAVDVAHENERSDSDALSLKVLDLSSSLALSEFSELHIAHAWQAFGENILRSGRVNISDQEVDNYVHEEELQHRNWVEALFRRTVTPLGEEALNYLTPQIHLLNGEAADVISQLTQDLRIDLIVMGTVARTGIPGFFMGNTAETILENIDCSVLAVKPEGFVSPVTLEDEK